MRRASPSNGFFLALLLNLLFNYPLGVLTLILWILHLWLGIPGFIPLIGLGVWVVTAFSVTAFFSLFAWIGESPRRGSPRRGSSRRKQNEQGSEASKSSDSETELE